MRTLADGKNHADILEGIPVLSSCTRRVLENFADLGVVEVDFAAGETLAPQSLQNENLCVLMTGSALLSAGDGVVISLEPGDYFGRSPSRHYQLVTSAVAVTDVTILVISPEEVAMLQEASCRDRHPSNIDWDLELPAATRRTPRRSRRPAALAS